MRALSTARQPGPLEWLFSFGIVLFGLLILGCQFLPGTTPENELTFVEGVPSNVMVTKVSSLTKGQRSIVECTLAPYHFEWASGDPHYDEIYSVLANRGPIQAWVSTKRERAVLNLDSARVRLYKLRAGGRQILSYSEAAGSYDSNALLIVGGAIALLGAFSVYINWQQSQNAQAAGRR